MAPALVLRNTFHLNADADSGFQSLPFLSAAVLTGALVGRLIGGYFTDRLGRRKMFLFDLVLLFFVTVLSARTNGVAGARSSGRG
jgi:MFS family permease